MKKCGEKQRKGWAVEAVEALMQPLGVKIVFKKAVTLQAASSWLPVKANLYQETEVRAEGAFDREVFDVDGGRGKTVVVQQLEGDLVEGLLEDFAFLKEGWPAAGDKTCLFEEDRVQRLGRTNNVGKARPALKRAFAFSCVAPGPCQLINGGLSKLAVKAPQLRRPRIFYRTRSAEPSVCNGVPCRPPTLRTLNAFVAALLDKNAKHLLHFQQTLRSSIRAALRTKKETPNATFFLEEDVRKWLWHFATVQMGPVASTRSCARHYDGGASVCHASLTLAGVRRVSFWDKHGKPMALTVAPGTIYVPRRGFCTWGSGPLPNNRKS